MKPEIRFEELIRSQQPTNDWPKEVRIILENIEEKDNMLYFTIQGQRFQTYDRTIQHEGCVMFDAAPTKVFAAMANEPESIERADLQNKQIDEEMDLWDKYGAHVCLVGFSASLKKYHQTQDVEAFLKEIKRFFDVMPNEKTNKMLRRLEDADNSTEETK